MEETSTSELIARVAEPIEDLESDNMDRLLQRVGDARIVLIGEASHGTSEFYRYRARITQALIEQKNFGFVAVEADWPDAARIDHYVRDMKTPPAEWTAFTRFPTWMWRNEEVREFVDWLREHNAGIKDPEQQVGFYGLDLYSLFTSIDAVLGYLEDVDEETAAIARDRYSCLAPFQSDPVTYGRATLTGRHRECEEDVVNMLTDLLNKRLKYTEQDGSRFMDAVQNARLVANAERYYRSMYSGYSDSWHLRDQHMFDTLEALLSYGGENSKVVVWEHNSHVGNARATDMLVRGQYNVGQLCREAYGDQAYLIGFGTHTGTVAAASDWGDPMEIKQVQPSLTGSWERLCHESRVPAFRLPLRHPGSDSLDTRLHDRRLERAIGVIYRPETERQSHYFLAQLAGQFDEYIWFDRTEAVTPLKTETLRGVPDTYPFGL
jgi:protein-L-isoaspartate(D-aspartate) O-methyltransferase